MSERESEFVKAMKRLNWTAIGIQLIILVFYIGVSYSRLTLVENNQKKQELDIKELSAEKADMKMIMMIKEDLTKNFDDFKLDLKRIEDKIDKK